MIRSVIFFTAHIFVTFKDFQLSLHPSAVPYLNAGVGRPPKVENQAFSQYQHFDPSEVVDLQSQQQPSMPTQTFHSPSMFNPPPLSQPSAGVSKTRFAFYRKS